MAVYKDKKRGTWFYSVYYKDNTGKGKVTKKRGFLKKSDAEMAEKMYLIEVKNIKCANRIIFSDLAAAFLKYKKERIKLVSYKSVKFKVDKLLSKFSDMYMTSITASDILSFQSYLINEKIGARHINRLIATLKEMFNWHDRFIGNIKMPAVDRLMQSKKDINFWSVAEFTKFINTFNNKDDNEYICFVYFNVLFYTGCRKGEAMALRWSDIDLENKTMSINKTLTWTAGTGSYLISTPKTACSARKILLPGDLISSLKLLIANQQRDKKFNSEWFVFGGSKPKTANFFDKSKIKHCSLANVKNIRMHDFRHSHASLLINNGASIMLVSKRLGHSNASITLSLYTHLYPSEENKLIAIIENVKKTKTD